ncbi:MAG: peptidoglycan-associated lipoprotein Pal [Thermodesulfovibrionales bacterium]|nr:peptidoglycan-associated lipoprotein Pal [Thermodesulfovibrionales bacterium]
MKWFLNFFRIVFIATFGVFLIFGCSQKKVAPTQEPSGVQNQLPIDKKDERLIAPQIKDEPKKIPPQQTEIMEKEIIKAQPGIMEAKIRELQSSLKDVYFDYDRYDIKEEAKGIIRELAQLMQKNKDIKVIIEGHCDERGTNEYNLGLGDKRANAVKNYLMSLGIPSKRIETVSYGEEKPVCRESTEACWSKNRRAHFVLIGDK